MPTYWKAAVVGFALTFLLLPIVRWLALRLKLYDFPDHTLKTHAKPTPRLGGIAIFLAIAVTLVAVRLVTDYPTGTIRNFRYILAGGTIIFVLGLLDDLKKGGIYYPWKLIVQGIAALILLMAPVSIKFLTPQYLASFLSVLWIMGITNSLNLVDIQDGLAGTQAAIAAIAFLAIGFPSEEIYVNILAAAVAGAILGFLPYNFSPKRKIFMGDSGSLTLGYFLAVLALGCSYSAKNPYAVFAPLLILGVPIFETFFLIYIRLKRGLNPLKGSPDHTAHRLKNLAFSETQILVAMGTATLLLSLLAFIITRVQNHAVALWIYLLLALELVLIGRRLQKASRPS